MSRLGGDGGPDDRLFAVVPCLPRQNELAEEALQAIVCTELTREPLHPWLPDAQKR